MEELCGVPKRKKPYYDSIPKRFDDLTDDLLIEIFLKLPAKILHRCKSVSKRWLSLISSSSFARSFISLSDIPTTKMLLFKLEYRMPYLPNIGQVYAIPLLHDYLVDLSSLPSSFDFIPPLNLKTVTDRVFMSIHLVGTYGGLVLLKGQFENRFLFDKIPRNYYNYYVCNPITKHWVELPLIRISDLVGFTCYYLQPAQGEEGRDSRIWVNVASNDHLVINNPNKIEFTVVSIKTNKRARVFVIHVLSSAEGVGQWNRRRVGQWNIRRVPFPPGWTSVPYSDTVVFANGKFHWCGENCIAAYDPFCKPLQCDLIPFPAMNPLDINDTGFFILKAFEGSLRLVRQSFTFKRLIAWDLVDYGNKVWVKNVDVRYRDQGRLLGFECFVGAEGAAKDKAYFLDYPNGPIMLFDVKNKSFQHFYYPTNLDIVTDLQAIQSVEPFISSPWPTPVPRLKNGNR